MSRVIMQPRTLAEIDSELAARGAEFDAIAATMLELDRHPGLTLLRGFPPTGLTERRWTPIRAELDLMWQDFARLKTILDSARTVRGTRSRLDAEARAELTTLLYGRPHEASRTPIPLAQRSLTGPGEQVLFVGVADTVDRMRATFPRIAAFLDEVGAVNDRVLSGLAPLQDRLDRAGATAELPDIGAAISELLRRSATDPLALTPPEIDARLADIGARLDRAADVLAELTSITANWAAAVAATRDRLTVLAETEARADRVRAEAEHKIRTGPLPSPGTERKELDAELAALAARSGAAAELLHLRHRIAAATNAAADAAELAQGLLDRRAELRGRLSAYRAKAARLALAEDDELSASHRIATELLAHRPCDLAAATRAVADYQHIVARKSGRRS
ncbi:hypothetical protein [Nocardia amikacinitolerans]|uniref:hypothetical protein n=1 Tax=Nocardia amikacinitolerans TaxID=756689 RepID=UPI0020A52A27|nr:hypothetical protein [Nocardia amikacinitolerans]